MLVILFVYSQSSGYNIVEYHLDTHKDIRTPVRFVMLSDLHNTDVTHDHNRRLVESIEALSPDFVILAGDMITSYLEPVSSSQKAYELLSELSKRFKVYYGLGNHEQRYREEPSKFPGRFDELEDHVKSLGIEFLSDAYCDVADTGIRIYGFDIPIDNYKRAVRTHLPKDILKDVFGDADKDRYDILIAHAPDHFDDYAAWSPDLVLSGHLHGGMIAIPGIGGVISPQLKLFPKYDFGKYTKGDTTMIVSRGIGWHSIPIRIFNKAEIVLITIGSADEVNDGDQC